MKRFVYFVGILATFFGTSVAATADYSVGFFRTEVVQKDTGKKYRLLSFIQLCHEKQMWLSAHLK